MKKDKPSKLLIISACANCNRLDKIGALDEYESFCNMEGRLIECDVDLCNEIPDWCPLEDFDNKTIENARKALESALAIIYEWSIDGHAEWCDVNTYIGICNCGHDQAVEMINGEINGK